MEAGRCLKDGQAVDLNSGGPKYDLAPPFYHVSALPSPDTTTLPYLVTLQKLHELDKIRFRELEEGLPLRGLAPPAS